MRSDDLVSLMAQGESETVEFNKSTAVMRDIIETICAFANHKGGSVFIGIKDDGQVLGQTVSDDTLKNLSNAIKLNTEPKIFPEVTKVEIEGKTCILIHVSESPLKPISLLAAHSPGLGQLRSD